MQLTHPPRLPQTSKQEKCDIIYGMLQDSRTVWTMKDIEKGAKGKSAATGERPARLPCSLPLRTSVASAGQHRGWCVPHTHSIHARRASLSRP